ncbi:MAG: type IV secretory system conjugative DNA transfer family protein, partial [Gammaproteobacteria bacterium]|nr:type IV secretory system conjugative DNA transfer family protein [Gammaproteobacteria bacterium]
YYGMRRYYDLLHRGMVSAPIIADAHSVMRQEDENTMVIGDTVFRVMVPSGFTQPEKWQPVDEPIQE